MNLDEAQRKKVADWIAQGLKLSDIQSRLASELGVSMTYMDVRLLVDDLKLTPKDVDRPKPVSDSLASAAPVSGGVAGRPAPATKPAKASPAGKPGAVTVSVDQIARPGAVASGKVTFSDGQQAEWQFDQMGRLGLVSQQPGYRPSAGDLQQFQMALEGELSRMGF
ncbi:conserved hypothetical protein [Verrucomicrobia bacterium]|nr:conserved hypothetical protein [Verrucomicrobiota bacterium]